ncbi:hypothetical protein [Streptomyces sp. 130]|uniref:hypothetical protein n=1 Tax=Streptomyces sp. 130 TaxID=2591006 RepID=UPI0021B0DD50|nr:hypothetical protein [Streptomyces sp. 130]
MDDSHGRIRGLPVRTAVDDLHDAARATAAEHGRLHAVRLLRRKLPGLPPSDAAGYARTLLDGEPCPRTSWPPRGRSWWNPSTRPRW